MRVLRFVLILFLLGCAGTLEIRESREICIRAWERQAEIDECPK